MVNAWSHDSVQHLLSETTCPRCGFSPLSSGLCSNCHADLRGDPGVTLWASTELVAKALTERDQLVAALPTFVPAAVPVAAPAAYPPPPAYAPMPGSAAAPGYAPAPVRESQVSVPSVLAVAGAGLVAVGALVFTFTSADLAVSARTLILAIITAVFLGGAWVLARMKIQFSAEAIGALGMVFLALVVWGVSQLVNSNLSGWISIGLGTLVASLFTLIIAAGARIRTWLWSGLVGLAATPAFFGYGITQPWAAIAGHVGVIFAALIGLELARRLWKRFGTALTVETVSLTALQVVIWFVVLMQLVVVTERDATTRALLTAAVFAAFALAAALSTRYAIRVLWSIVVGASLTVAAGAAVLAIADARTAWALAIVPAAASVMLVLVAGVSAALPVGALANIRRDGVVSGSWALAIVATIPAGLWACAELVVPISARPDNAPSVAASVGLAALTVGTALMALIVRPQASRALHISALTAAFWFGVGAVGSVVVWQIFDYPLRVGLGLAFVLVASALLLVVMRSTSLARRLPLVLGAHLFVLYVAIISWTDDTLSIVGGFAAAVALVLLSRLVPAVLRPLHIGLAYAYSLIILAHALTVANLDGQIILGVTTGVAALCAIAATVVRPLRVAYWYAILMVTAIPFFVSIAWLFADRTIWAALSTGLVFALALTIVLVRRAGTSVELRGFAAALLVPSLAVITIALSVGEHHSGSPIALPIIAGIVAVVLPLTVLIGRGLVRLGDSEQDARFVRLAIEGSALVTGAIAVIIALARIAAGLDIAFWVLAIVGVGAVAAWVFAGRTYARIVAFVSFTLALWCFLGLQNVDVPEAYILPPALAGAIIGAIAIALGRSRGRWYYWIGLGIATVATLGLLAVRGNGVSAVFPWRTGGLLAFAILLIAIGALVGRSQRFSPLRQPSLVIAMVAAGAGMLQGIRFGWALDATTFQPRYLIVGALIFAVGAALLAAAAAWLLHRAGVTGRWLYMPAGVYLVLGPIASVRHAWFPIWTLAALTLLLLLVLVFTAAVSRTRAVTLPPVWFTFALAWCTAVASWSQRELYVETYSLALGLALLAAGIIAMRGSTLPRSFSSWPNGFTGSWRVLSAGTIVIFLASVLSTGTNPATWRAVLVIGMALVAIIVGSRLKLAAPFIIGLIVLPIENVIIFAVQAGGHIEASTWWITLGSAGVVLLGIAVTSERRTAGSQGGVAARMRDLK